MRASVPRRICNMNECACARSETENEKLGPGLCFNLKLHVLYLNRNCDGTVRKGAGTVRKGREP